MREFITRREQYYLAVFLLIAITLAAYYRAPDNGFIENLDDSKYVLDNPAVQAGLTANGIVWAFTSVHASNWHPLTWLSHMMDCWIYKLKPRGHHLTNLLFHLANVFLLFLVFSRMTGSVWRSAFVAALFGVHPLHVESVAWIAERKDVLSTFFWLLTILAYVSYVKQPNIRRYLLVALLFALGLMSKPMLVTLPLTLLLLDYWPLGRLKTVDSKSWNLVWEKIPLFILAGISCVVTFMAQKMGGAVAPMQGLPVGMRVANALVSYVEYILKMIWPIKLAAFYPHSGNGLPEWQVVGAGVLLVCISALAVLAGRRNRYIAVGWLWYMITLVPVIGLMQVGGQAMADRYTYVPLIGLFIIIAWGAPDLLNLLKPTYRYLGGIVLSIASCVIVLAFAACSWVQVGYWKNDIILYEHVLQVVPNNALANTALGNALAAKGDIRTAIFHYRKAIKISPGFTEARNDLGAALLSQGKIDAAISEFRELIRLAPKDPVSHNNLGTALAKQGNLDAAILEFQRAITLNPEYAKAKHNLKLALALRGKSGKPESD